MSLVSSSSESSVSVLIVVVGLLVLEGVVHLLGGVLMDLARPILFVLSRCVLCEVCVEKSGSVFMCELCCV